MKIIDISLEIKEGMIRYPGNPNPQINRYASIPKNKTNESLVKMGSHTGTHIDASLHIDGKTGGTEKISLNNFYGECRVLDLSRVGREIKEEDLAGFKIKKNEIILLKTENSKKGYKKFRKDFAYLSDGAAEYLAKKKIKTLGFDYISIVKFGSDSQVHKILLKNKITIFEGLDLSKVKQGKYIFAGFPLKINSDAAPARAVLVEV